MARCWAFGDTADEMLSPHPWFLCIPICFQLSHHFWKSFLLLQFPQLPFKTICAPWKFCPYSQLSLSWQISQTSALWSSSRARDTIYHTPPHYFKARLAHPRNTGVSLATCPLYIQCLTSPLDLSPANSSESHPLQFFLPLHQASTCYCFLSFGLTQWLLSCCFSYLFSLIHLT